ncbi:uncharacterized protein Hap1MRO34_013107 [Clarias gariepinus]
MEKDLQDAWAGKDTHVILLKVGSYKLYYWNIGRIGPKIELQSENSSLPAALEWVPNSSWAEHRDEVGFVHDFPYEAKLKHSQPVYIKQYPLSEDKASGIDEILSSLLKQDVVKPCMTYWCPPLRLLFAKKPPFDSWHRRFSR